MFLNSYLKKGLSKGPCVIHLISHVGARKLIDRNKPMWQARGHISNKVYICSNNCHY